MSEDQESRERFPVGMDTFGRSIKPTALVCRLRVIIFRRNVETSGPNEVTLPFDDHRPSTPFFTSAN